MSIHDLIANKEAKHYRTTLVYYGVTQEAKLFHYGREVTQDELDKRYPTDENIGLAAYANDNPDKTHVR